MRGMIYNIHDQPGLKSSPSERSKLLGELRGLAALSFDPIPNYQCFSSEPGALDDKVIITAHKEIEKKNAAGEVIEAEQGELVAFTSALLLQIEGVGEVLHTGLTVVDGSIRRQGLLVQLFMRLLLYVYSERAPIERLWISNISEIPNSLAHIAIYMGEVFPSPAVARPSATQLLIARAINNDRERMLIAQGAVFHEKNFVFEGCCDMEGGHVFVKDVHDPQNWNRDQALTDYYRGLVKTPGDEVLQVGYLDEKLIAKGIAALTRRSKI